MQTTSNDADQIAKYGIPVVQIATINGCHLDANLVGKACRKIDLSKVRLIFVENIGNLICPAEFPLGSKARVVVVSVTEGPYMVRKHPHMFLGAQIVVINKIDLAAAMEVSVEDLARDVHTLKPDIKVIPTSCKTGEGLDEVAKALMAFSSLSDLKSNSRFMERSRLRNEVSLPDRLLKFRLWRQNRRKSCFFSARCAVLVRLPDRRLCAAGYRRKFDTDLNPAAC